MSPYFIGVDSITDQTTFKYGFDGASNQFGTQNTSGALNAINNAMISPLATLSKAPTIIYSPLQGSKFVAGLLNPLDLRQISFLFDAGWSASTIFKLMFSQVGSLTNARSVVNKRSQVISSNIDAFDKFADTAEQMHAAGHINFDATEYNGNTSLLVQLRDQKTIDEVARNFKFKKKHDKLILTRFYNKSESTPENVIHVKTRSLYSMMSFLSEGVATPNKETAQQHGVQAKVILDENNNGKLSNELAKGLFMIQSSKDSPKNAITKVKFKDMWYYVPTNDSHSKEILSLLHLIYSMQIGDSGNTAPLPIVTIPVR
jgi:hypothetical protein